MIITDDDIPALQAPLLQPIKIVFPGIRAFAVINFQAENRSIALLVNHS